MRIELGLAWAGLRHRPAPWLLLALGVALAALMPLIAAGLQQRAAVVAVRQAVASVPDQQRGVVAVTSRDLRGADLAGLDAQVRAGLQAAGLAAPEQALAFRLLALQGTDTTVGALQRLPDDVTLTSGRLPASCTPTACEVIAVGVDDKPPPDVNAPARELGLVITGTATLHQPLLAGLGLVAPGAPMLLSNDPAALADLSALTSYGRNLAWFSPLDGPAVAARGTASFAAALDQVSADADLVAGPLNVVWPDDLLTGASTRADDAAVRFAVLGVGVGALQLGFCLVLAATRRPAQQHQTRLLLRRGAHPGQVLATAVLQALLTVLVGALLGTAGGALAVAALDHTVGVGPVAGAVAAVGTAWPGIAALGLAAVTGSVALAAWPCSRPTAVRAAGIAVVALAGSLATLALVRPTTDPDAPLPIAALGALTLGAGVVAALLWSPAVAGLARMDRRRPPLRTVALLVHRRPLLPGVTAGFLAAALATALLAASYAGTLRGSAQDRAAAAVPLDVRVSPSTRVRLPGAAVDTDAVTAAGPGVVVSGLTSTTVTAFAGSSTATALPLTGIDPAVLPLVHRWASVTGSATPASEVAERLRASSAPTDAPVVPAGTRELSVDARGLDADVVLGVWMSGPDGQEQQVVLVPHGGRASATMDAGPARTVRAVEITEAADHSTFRQHGLGEGKVDQPLPNGTLDLGAVRADGTTLPWSWAGWGSDSVRVMTSGSGLRARYAIRDARAVLVPGWVPTARRTPIPVAVDTITAARAGPRGTFAITLNQTTQPVQVVAVIPRMPTLPTTFVVADRDVAAALVDRLAPGTAPVAQVWVATPEVSLGAVRSALGSSLAAAATVQYRSDLAAGFAEDPVSSGFVRLLGVAGAIALLLAVVAVVGGIRGDRSTSGADLFALEVDGVAPRRLRSVLATRAGLVLAVGLPLGVLGGIGVAGAAVRLLATGPDGRLVTPPLRLVLISGPTVGVALAAVVGLAAAALLTAAAALREPTLRQPELDLR